MKYIQSLLRPTSADDILTQLRLRYCLMLAGAAVLVSLFGAVNQINTRAPADVSLGTPILGVLYGLALLYLAYRRFLRAVTLFLVIFSLIMMIIIPVDEGLVLGGFFAIVTAAALLDSVRLYMLVNVFVFGRITVESIRLIGEGGGQVTEGIWGVLRVALALLLLSVVARFFIDRTREAVDLSRRSANLLRATAEVGQITTAILDVQALLERAVDLIRDRFGFYHVQVFLIDESGGWAELVASTGDAGRALLARRHRLAVGSTSVIGRVTRVGEPLVARQGERNSVHRVNELLPQTRAELAVPISDGERTIGALDVQSTRIDAFGNEDVQALQTMANLLGATIRNARLFAEQQRSVDENQRLFIEAESNLREIQRLNQQLTRAGWNDYLRQPQNLVGITLDDGEIKPNADWTDALVNAAQNRREVTTEANGRPAVMAVPVVLRGEVIGAIEVEPGERIHTEDSVEMLKAIAQRLAISLDNARLIEEAQSATAQEQQINAMVARLQNASTVDELLRVALTDLSESLGARRGAIRLGRLQQPTPSEEGDAAP